MGVEKFLYGNRLYRKVNRMLGLPTLATVEPTTRCNLQCKNCRSLVKETDGLFEEGRDMTMEEFEILLKKLPFIQRYELAGLGEPFLNPHIFEIIAKLNRRGKETAINTNGTILDEETRVNIIESGLSKLCLSIDGAKADTFDELREGAHLPEIVANIRKLTELKTEMRSTTPLLLFNVVASRDNQDELTEILYLAHSLGVPVVRINNLYAPFPEMVKRKIADSHAEKLITELRELARELGIELRTFKDGRGCVKHVRGFCLTVDGNVTPCFFAYYPGRLQFGNLFESKFTAIWNSPPYKEVRATKVISKDAKIPQCCRQCSYAGAH